MKHRFDTAMITRILFAISFSPTFAETLTRVKRDQEKDITGQDFYIQHTASKSCVQENCDFECHLEPLNWYTGDFMTDRLFFKHLW